VAGDERGREVLLATLDTMQRAIEWAGGVVVDRIGDELMCTFPDAPSTLRGAVAVQRSVEEMGAFCGRRSRLERGVRSCPSGSVHSCPRVSGVLASAGCPVPADRTTSPWWRPWHAACSRDGAGWEPWRRR
jgi:hypothetical protein